MKKWFLLCVAMLAVSGGLEGLVASPTEGRSVRGHPTVKITRSEKGYQLLRNGQPYFIKGGGGWRYLDQLKAAGGNSLRTWGAPTDGALLDKAQELGLTVTFGIWLGHKDHGFDYNDPKQVKDQFGKAKAIVERYKDHPALLIWGVGNEMEGVEGMERGWVDPAVWTAVEDVAKMIKREDPDHPVVTVVAEFNAEKIAAIKKYCPSLDALGINSYGTMLTLPERLRKAGWGKPYIVTEFGPAGPWQTQTTPWGAPIEESSTLKAYDYLCRYYAAVASQDGWCLGSYVYLWGMEERDVSKTHTWYAMFMPGGGERLGAVEAMTLAWTGKFPDNRAPEIIFCQTDAAFEEVVPGSQHTAAIFARDPDGDPLEVRWEVRPEIPTLAGPAPQPLPECILHADGMRLTYGVPKKPGGYRLFIYIYDRKGNGASANIPFLVKAESVAGPGKATN